MEEMQEEKEEDIESQKETKTIEQKTIIISRDNINSQLQSNTSNHKNIEKNKENENIINSLKVYLNLTRFHETDEFQREMDQIQNAIDVELIINKSNKPVKQQNNKIQYAWLKCLKQLNGQRLQRLNISFQNISPSQADLERFSLTLNRLKHLTYLSLDLFQVITFRSTFCEISSAISGMSNLQELSIFTQDCLTHSNMINLSNHISKLARLLKFTYHYKQFNHMNVSPLLSGIKCLKQLQYLDITINILENELGFVEEMFRNLNNLKTIKLKLSVVIYDNSDAVLILEQFFESILGIQSLNEIDLESNLMRYVNNNKIRMLIQNIYRQLCNLKVLKLKIFELKDNTDKSSNTKNTLGISTEISQIINLKKIELNIYQRNVSYQNNVDSSMGQQIDQHQEIAKNIRLLQGINELVLVIGEKSYKMAQAKKNNKKSKKIKGKGQEYEGDEDDKNIYNSQTAQDLLRAISSLKKLVKLNLKFEDENYIGDEGWEEFRKIQNLKELRICIQSAKSAVSISSTTLSSLSSVLQHMRTLQVFSFAIENYSNASSNGWIQFFQNLGKVIDIEILELKIGQFNQINHSIGELGQAIKKMLNLRELFVFLDGCNSVQVEDVISIGNALEQLRQLRKVRIIDKNKRDGEINKSEAIQKIVKKKQYAFSEQNNQWKSLRNLRYLEEITIDYDTGQQMSFQQILELSQMLVDMERLVELDLDVVIGKHRMIGWKVTGQLNNKSYQELPRILKYPSNIKFIPAEKDDEYCQQNSTIRFKTANGMVFGYLKAENNFNTENPLNQQFSSTFKDLSQLPVNTSQLTILLVERNSKQLSLNLKDLGTSLMNLYSCRKLTLNFDGFKLPQEQFEQIISSLYAMSNLQSLSLRFSTDQLSEDIAQDLSVIQLQLHKAKFYIKLDPFLKQSAACMIFMKSLIANEKLQKLDLQLLSFYEIYLQIERKITIKDDCYDNVIVIDISEDEEEKNHFERILEIYIKDYSIPEEDEFIESLSNFFYDQEIQNVFQKLILNIEQGILHCQYQDQEQEYQSQLLDLFRNLKHQSELKIFKLIISSINRISTDQIISLAQSIGFMDNLIELELKIHSDRSFKISNAISIIPDILDIPGFILEIQGNYIILSNTAYPPENVIVFLQDEKIAILKRSTNEDMNNIIKPSEISELFRQLNKFEKLKSLQIDMTCFKNDKNYKWEKFKHIQSLQSLTLTINYPDMSTQLQGMFIAPRDSFALRILHLKVFLNSNENIEMFGGELKNLRNLTQLKIILIWKQQQKQKQLECNDNINDKDNYPLCNGIKEMLHLEQVSIQVDEKSQISAQYLANLTTSLLSLPKLKSLMLSLFILEDSQSLIACLGNLKLLRNHSQLYQTDISIRQYFILGFKSIDLEQSYDLSYPLLEKKTILFSSKDLFYEISLPDYDEQEETNENKEMLEKQKFKELLRTIDCVWEEGIDKMVIIIEDYKYFRRSILFFKELVVFLRETDKILPFLRLSLKALEQNQLLELCQTALGDKQTINVNALKIFFLHGSVETFEWLFDEFRTFFKYIVGLLQKTRTLIFSTLFDGKQILRLSNIAKRKMHRLVNLNTGKVEL